MSFEKNNKVTNWAAIKNATFLVEGVGNQNYNNYYLVGGIIGLPLFVVYYLGLGFWSFIILLLPLGFLVFAGSFLGISRFSSPQKCKIALPGKNIEDYIRIKDSSLSEYS